MSQENVETVRRWLAARGASSDETHAAIAEFFDPDVDYYPVRKFPEAQPFRPWMSCGLLSRASATNGRSPPQRNAPQSRYSP